MSFTADHHGEVLDRCLHVDVAADDRELAADALWELGAVAVEERDDLLVAGFGDGDALARAHDALASRWRVRVVDVGEAWLDAWRPFARPVRVGRVVVRPAWVPLDDHRDGDVVVDLDPGRSFGSGDHPTTRMALAQLVARVRPGDRVLDVGCGSGVLAVAAARLGAACVVAVDVEDDAVAVTRANAETNGVAHVVDASTTPLGDVPGHFDLVVANLGGSDVLRALADALAARVADGGVLVLGGMLDDALVDACPGCAVEEVVRDEGWATVVLRLAPSAP